MVKNYLFSILSISSIYICLGDILSIKAQTPGKLVLWSPSADASAKPAQYITRSLETRDVEKLASMSLSNKDVVLFLVHKDGRSLLSHPWISTSFKSSPESKVLTSIYKNSAEHPVPLPLPDSTLKNAEKIAIKDLPSRLDKIQPLSANENRGEVQSFIVTVSGDVDESSRQLESISQFSRHLTMLLIAGEEPTAELPETLANYNRILVSQFDGPGSNSTKYSVWEGGEFSIYYYGSQLYITPDIFTGAMTGLFFFFTLYTGFSCLGAIQGPGTFATKLPPLGKEG